ncbi:MAG: phosphoribosylglycinamide formyltransferase [Ignavibacteria bacterium]|jgi:phosphoribosylglycinamide formyltransferase-1|nr:phosphoribosylglycinamide formyltransferase [Ignavibacteria bacterium]
MRDKLKLGFMCSGNGSNMQAIINSVRHRELNASLCAMITNNPDAGAIAKAKYDGVPTFVINEKTNGPEYDGEIVRVFLNHNVDYIVLAGYMKHLTPFVIDCFQGHVLNIHPALLPKFGGKGMYGMNVHKAVLEAGEKVSGATVHQVNSEYDAGTILGQMEVAVMENDTPETLAKRVLKAEHQLYSKVLINISKGLLKLEYNRPADLPTYE